jgi:DNA-binding transcriptional LysR family regulator
MRRGVPSLSALQAFEATARYENFSKAADELSQTHGAICKKVNELEADLGVTLFQRVRQRLVLTAAGAEYARCIRVHLDQIRRDTVDLISSEKAIHIDLAVGVTFAAQWLIPRLQDFYAKHADIRVHIIGRDQPQFFNDSNFDATIYFGQNLWPGMPGYPLISDDDLLLVCSPELMAGRTALSAEEIRCMAWIQTRDIPRAWQEWCETLDGQRPDRDVPDQQYDMFIMAINATLSGMGLALLPRILIDRELMNGTLVQAHSHVVANPNTIYFAFPEQRREWRPLRQFQEWLYTAARDYRQHIRCAINIGPFTTGAGLAGVTRHLSGREH